MRESEDEFAFLGDIDLDSTHSARKTLNVGQSADDLTAINSSAGSSAGSSSGLQSSSPIPSFYLRGVGDKPKQTTSTTRLGPHDSRTLALDDCDTGRQLEGGETGVHHCGRAERLSSDEDSIGYLIPPRCRLIRVILIYIILTGCLSVRCLT